MNYQQKLYKIPDGTQFPVRSGGNSVALGLLDRIQTRACAWFDQ